MLCDKAEKGPDSQREAHIETVELGDAVLRDELRDGRIPLREPSEELGDTGYGSATVLNMAIRYPAWEHTYPILQVRSRPEVDGTQQTKTVRFRKGANGEAASDRTVAGSTVV